MAYTTIDNPELYFKVKTYTGNGTAIGSGGNAITGVGFQPDFTWIKSTGSHGNQNFDSVRGATKVIWTDDTGAEVTRAESLTTWGADGFTCGSDGDVNTNTQTYISWNWIAGTTSGITTTGANITPSAYSMNATSGISIIKYEGNGTDGTNTAHALGAVPHMIICKRLENANYWAVYHRNTHADPEDYYLILNATDVRGDAGIWKDTPPTSVYFRHDNSTSVNANGEDMIAYLFTSIQGYSKFSGFTGNGNADGTFVYTGFRPAWVMIKRADGANGWVIYDNTRQGYNANNDELFADVTDAEVTTDDRFDILSNGFKCRSASQDHNGNGSAYIYAAFAEQPFVNSNGVPCNAR